MGNRIIDIRSSWRSGILMVKIDIRFTNINFADALMALTACASMLVQDEKVGICPGAYLKGNNRLDLYTVW